ncbi:YbaB/EbfC family nucleoid-associated protein [Amycolatopsis sp. DG1A-15b]|uniref:YbaB/EbfC family nucleoid-associated protein n=1 Tax=Amycolatopsis sp. DG1A-15b TaxID=3052846 RepID=UPI00255B7666|nr:YbaB/EbfC family nucleoid-associated protein [Amycolatopsis sp. DG1A-15b]WIX85699.1 YbaB/EbfC family nucleoid-associated protein [Amycolatopsis sp. DG1A-15b]
MDLSDVERMVVDWERNAEEKARRYQEMSRQVSQVSITGSAADGAVQVTVGANGVPSDVAMTPKVRQLEPERIAAAVMEAMHDAQSQYPQRLAEIMAQTVGDDSTTRHLLAEAQANFPLPQEKTQEPARGQQRPPDDPDDFSNSSFLDRDR